MVLSSTVMMERRIKVKKLNKHITCEICKGYLIDATTVTECVHTFCKSCLVKHLEENNKCPTCKLEIHTSHPLQYISFDRTMQDLVYKLVPELQNNEIAREREFYRTRNLSNPKDIVPSSSPQLETKAVSDYHRRDELVNVCLECMKTTKRIFIRCSVEATILHLQKFVAKKILNSVDEYRNVDLYCNKELLGRDHTLKFVYVTRWRIENPPLTLQYRHKIN